MRLRRFLLVLLGVATACSTDSQPETTAAALAAQRRQAIAQLRIPFANPVLLDSSAEVLYPLPLHELVTEETSSYGSGSNYDRQDLYWNILFYNTRSGASHLLAADRRLVIRAYHVPDAYGNTAGGSGEASHPRQPRRLLADRLIFYSATLADTNRDSELTTDDATYLFTSDRAGQDFRQISPDSLHVTSWEVQRSTGLILMQTLRDTNRNRSFGDGDETIPYCYDPATRQPAQRLFAPAALRQLRAAFQRKWEKKPAR